VVYHVLNRGNGRLQLFRKERDFAAFENVLGQGLVRYPVELLTYCLMGNHWHLVVRPRTDEALGRFMGWVGVTHVRRHHAHYHIAGGGHLYQGRFKSFPVEEDSYFMTLCRYVEANPLRAKLVERAEDWPWCGMFARRAGDKPLVLSDWPVDRPANWSALVNRQLDEKQLDRVRLSVTRGRPLGSDRWVTRMARRLRLEFTLRPRGRPRKGKE
jgi:putative transposase